MGVLKIMANNTEIKKEMLSDVIKAIKDSTGNAGLGVKREHEYNAIVKTNKASMGCLKSILLKVNPKVSDFAASKLGDSQGKWSYANMLSVIVAIKPKLSEYLKENDIEYATFRKVKSASPALAKVDVTELSL